MEDMYDYTYDYNYEYQTTGGEDVVVVALASLWLVIMLALLVFSLGSYLLHSFGLYTIAKRMGKPNAWLAFIPLANTYYQGELAGPIRLKNKTIKNPGIWKLLLPIIYGMGVGIYVFIMVLIFGVALVGSAVSMNMASAGVGMMAFFVMYIIVILAAVVFMAVQITLNVLINKQIYENFCEGNMPVVHAVLSATIPLYEAICLFVMRKRPFIGIGVDNMNM